MSWLSKGIKKAKKVVKKVGGVIDKADPTGVTSFMASGGTHKGGAISGVLGAGVKKKSTTPTERTRYKRRKRNPWKSKRQKAFEQKGKERSLGMISAGIKGTINGAKKKKKKGKFSSAVKAATRSFRKT